ncbi:efflux RND transporter periplasmic adaptor subunit [Alkaliphilus transvaalensis]|uniref:efflux RND transporter periplasmic adaptor subunit n=1 Tax=Alkaliphilus transvaalensis TaxID=114628 RepID=UPI00047E2CD3|nr:efflux RND transporter periplasmic adaptor subunit [Alkaliphilus transvaalensis]
MKKKWLMIIAIVILLGGGIFARGMVRNRNRFVEVRTSQVALGDLKAYLSTTAIIKSQDSKEYFGLQGRVKEVHVSVGDTVEIGDVLVSYEVQDLTTTLRQAEIQYSNAVLQRQELVNQNKQILDRIRELEEELKELEASDNPLDLTRIEGLKQQKSSLQPISQERLKQADNAVELAQLTVASTKEKISENKDKIVSENRGVVTDVTVVAGGASTGAQPAVIVQDITNLKAEASIGRYDANIVAVGQPAIIKNGNETYQGEVSFLHPVARRSVSAGGNETLLAIEVAIKEEATNLKVDFSVDIDILVGEANHVIKIPAESIRRDRDGRYYVFVVEDQKAREREITLGLESDMEAEVIEGLQVGESIIINPRATLRDGSLVTDEAGGRGR